jgi:hypothetical protein
MTLDKHTTSFSAQYIDAASRKRVEKACQNAYFDKSGMTIYHS